MAKIEVDETYLRELIGERDRLALQVTDLQARGTELVEESRQGSITTMVSEFHLKFGYPTYYLPTVPIADADVRFRAMLITEEYFEAMSALFGECVEAPHKMMSALISDGNGGVSIKLDMPEFADALGDLDYVVEGTRLTFGIPRLPIAFAIQEANMAKTRTMLEGADAAKMGGWVKPIKPPGWQPPDIARVLADHGWRAP